MARSTRQSRLRFTPLPSSSPAAKTYNKQIRDRAAAVTIQPSPSSKSTRRQVQEISDDEDDHSDSVLPTPAGTTNEHVNGNNDSDSEPVRTASRRPDRSSPVRQESRSTRKTRVKQKQLDFSNARDAGTFDSPVRLTSSRPISSGKGVFASAGQLRMIELSSDSGSGSGSDSDLPSARKILARSKEEAKQKKTKNRRVTRASQRPVVLSDSDQEGIVTARKSASKVVADDEKEEDSGEDMPTTEGRLPRKRRTRRASIDSFISDSPPAAVESEDDVVEVTRSRRKRRRQDSEEEEEQEAIEEDTHKTPRRRLAKRPRQLSQREQDDLAEDLADLGSSSDAPSSPQPPRSTQSAEKQARLKALERLKKKRGQPLEQVEEQDEDGNDDEEQSVTEQGEDSDVEEVAAPISSHQMFRPDENDEDFLVEEEDDDDPLGIPEGVPLQFTRYASMRGKELFKFAILWMVQKKINPGFDMNAEIFKLTFRKLDDEVRGLASSKYTSSVWSPEFTIALQARPEIAYHKPGGPLKDKCDACNRSSHPATYEIQFQKKPYHRDSLEDVDDKEDDDEDDDDEDSDSESAADTPDYDSQGRKVVPESTIFYVGRFCTANAKTAHALEHWKYQLYDFVVIWLDSTGYLKPDKIVQRDKLSTKKRGKQARKILERMEDSGEIRSLWKTFRESIDAARDAKQSGRFGGESP